MVVLWQLFLFICRRGTSGNLFKNPAKMGSTVKAYGRSYVIDGGTGALQKLFCLFNADVIQVFHKMKTGGFPEGT